MPSKAFLNCYTRLRVCVFYLSSGGEHKNIDEAEKYFQCFNLEWINVAYSL